MSDDEPCAESKLAASAERLRREFDRWLEAAASQGERALDAMGLRGERPCSPRVDLIETADAILVDVDLPGADPATVDVSLAGNMLTIKGSVAAQPAEDGRTVHLSERRHGAFSRSLPLPAPVDAERVTAEVTSGILHVKIAKAEQAKPRQIRVNAPVTQL